MHTSKEHVGQKEISIKILKYFKLNENRIMNYHNSWDVVKAVLCGKCVHWMDTWENKRGLKSII